MIGHNALVLCVLICQASARAMDTIQALVYQTTGNAVSKFMVAGLSKVGRSRGTHRRTSHDIDSAA